MKTIKQYTKIITQTDYDTAEYKEKSYAEYLSEVGGTD